MRLTLKTLAMAAGLAVAIGLTPAASAPLDESVCKEVDARQKLLELQGIKDDLAKGPEWAKANVTLARLAVIKEYIELKEQVAFRCPSLVVVSVPELAEPEATAPLADPAAKAADKPAAKPKKKKKRKAAEAAAPAPAAPATKTE